MSLSVHAGRVLVIALVVALGPTALAADYLADDAQLWRPHRVRYPVAPDQLSAGASALPVGARVVRGPVEVSPTKIAVFWLDSLRVVRVRASDPETGENLRFGRITRYAGDDAEASARALIEEPGIAVRDGVYYLAQPPGGGAAWYITATTPVSIHVEHLEQTLGHTAWESVRRAVIDWIAAGTGDIELPPFAGMSEMRARLLAERDVATAIAEAWPASAHLSAAARAWRSASALQQLSAVRPLVRDYFRVTRVDDTLADLGARVTVGESQPYRRLDRSEQTWQLALAGPGVMRLYVRAVLGGDGLVQPGQKLTVTVKSGTRTLGVSSIEPYPVSASRSPATDVFPERQDVTLDSGERVGPLQRLAVATLPGRHVYHVQIVGGPALVRAVYGERRSLASESLRARDDAGDFIRRAQRSLRADRGPGGRLIHLLVDELSGRSDSDPDLADELPPLLAALADIVRARGDVASAAVEPLMARAVPALSAAPDALGWYLRIELANILAERGAHHKLRELLSAAESSPPPALLPALAAALPPPRFGELSRSRPVAMMDLAWRAAPVDDSVRGRYLTIWREQASWQRLTPSLYRERRVHHDTQIWLKRTADQSDDSDAWGLLPLGEKMRVLAPAAPSDGTRPALLRLAVATPADQPGPVSVIIDGHRFTSVALHSIERWEFAVASGPHDVHIEAPPGTEVYCSLPLAEGQRYRATARIQQAWPLTSGQRPIRYDLPAPHVQGPVRVRLRALISPNTSYRSTVRMITDLGPDQTIHIEWDEVDADAQVVDGDSTLSAAATFVVTPPVGAHHIWFESASEIPIVASVAVRRPRGEPSKELISSTPVSAALPLLEQISALSQGLSDTRPDPTALLRRARLLLDMEFPDLARRDAARALRPGSGQVRDMDAVRAILTELDTFHSPMHLPATSPAGRAEKPVPVYPAALALPGHPTPAILEAARAVRAGAPGTAIDHLARATIETDPRAYYARHRIASTQNLSGQSLLSAGRALVRLGEHTRTWQVAREACLMLGRMLEMDDADPGVASFIFGVARELDGLGTLPVVRRVLLMASPLSRWTAINSADATGGYQRLMVEPGPDEQEPAELIRDALVAAPWRAQMATDSLRPGRSVALQVELLQPASLRADIWCRQLLLARAGESTDCRITVLVDGQAIASARDGEVFEQRAVELGRALPFTTPVLARGPHRIEVELARASRLHRAAVRFAADRALPESTHSIDTEDGRIFPIQRRRPATAFVATPDPKRRVVVTVNGPTALLITSRSSAVNPASRLEVTVEGGGGGKLLRAVPLAREVDPYAALRAGTDQIRELTRPSTVVIPVPDAGAHRVTIAPDSGLTYVRVAMRVDRPSGEHPTADYWQPDIRPEDELLRWPGAPAEMAVLEGGAWHRPHDRGTFSVEAVVRRNDLEDVEEVPLLTRLDVALDWRRRLKNDRVWLHLGATGRQHFDGRSVFGARARIQTARLPLGLRTYAETRLFMQVVAANPETSDAANLEWRATARVDVERPVRLTSDLTLTPELSMRTSALSLTFDQVPVPGPEIDPDIYGLYVFFHRHALIPRIALRWRPFQDQIGSLSAAAVPNADLASLDRIQTTLSWSALVHLTHRRVAIARVSYRPSYRFYDEDRFYGYARHDLSARVEGSLWTGRSGRLLVQASVATYLSSRYGRDDTFTIGLAYDLTGGRGLRDMFSFEEEFDPYVEGRLFTYNDAP